MKKILSLVLATVLLLSLAACGSSGGGESKTPAGLQVGFGRVNITPEYATHLNGYGNYETRISEGYIDYLYATCVAISEGGNTVLLITIDNLSAIPSFTLGIEPIIANKVGVPVENILFGATHTHSAPNYMASLDACKQYREQLSEGIITAAEDAVADLSPATAYTGSQKLEKMTFVRHYITEDGTYMGSNFNEDCKSPIVGYASEADNELRLLKFDRGEKPAVLMANWQAHVDHAAKNGMSNLSADYPGAFRDKVEEDTGMLVAYFTGASGNLAAHSRILADANDNTMRGYGEDLAEFAIGMLDSMTPVANTTGVKGKQTKLTAKIDHTWDHMILPARQMKSIWDKEGRDAANEAGKEHGFTSVYQANAIISRASMGPTDDFVMNVAKVGGIAFVNPTYEMFCESGRELKDNSGYDVTFIIAGNHLYLPVEKAYNYRCYEADTGFYEKGTAETLVSTFIDMLKEIKEG